VDEAHGTYLVLCRCNGSLELYELPGMRLLAQFQSVHEGDFTVPTSDPEHNVRMRTACVCGCPTIAYLALIMLDLLGSSKSLMHDNTGCCRGAAGGAA
jgi:hypothetical protein